MTWSTTIVYQSSTSPLVASKPRAMPAAASTSCWAGPHRGGEALKEPPDRHKHKAAGAWKGQLCSFDQQKGSRRLPVHRSWQAPCHLRMKAVRSRFAASCAWRPSASGQGAGAVCPYRIPFCLRSHVCAWNVLGLTLWLVVAACPSDWEDGYP
jgi:hypothetical protein